MTRSDNRTVLLARPGDVRQRLQEALTATGVELVHVADPIDVDVDGVIALAPRNVVIAVDADVEDVFERFDTLLASDAHRVLIEEAAIVAARGGWDVARWSRHLAAKLLGHDNVLPEGFEPDDEVENTALAAAETSLLASDMADFSECETANDATELAAETLELAPYADVDQEGHEGAPAPNVEGLALPPGEDSEVDSAPLFTAVDPGSALPDATQWNQYQDFEARSDIPAANLDGDVFAGYAGALAVDAEQDLAPEEALQRISDDIEHFDTGVESDRWQDFERPAPEQEAAVSGAEQADVHQSWSLEDVAQSSVPPPLQIDADRLKSLETSISTLSLVDDDEVVGTQTVSAQSSLSTDGMVLVLGGLGGPDPLRQILQQLPSVFPAPLLVQQSLDGGHYDRLVRQIARNSQLPVELATDGMPIQDSHAYILPHGIGIKQQGIGDWQFVETGARGFADVLSALPAVASAAVVLSGASEDNVEPLLRFQQSGGEVLAQAGEGCYDHAVPGLMATRGAKMDQPAGLVTRLNLLWPSMEPK